MAGFAVAATFGGLAVERIKKQLEPELELNDLSVRAAPGEGPASQSLVHQPVSLAVKDLGASKTFFEKLGFSSLGGDPTQGWQILKNGSTVIGLFDGMFEKNILTFNPGWDQGAKPLDSFTDVRDIQRSLDAAGVELTTRADPDGTGPAHITLNDPDGNVIMFDQHVDQPRTAP